MQIISNGEQLVENKICKHCKKSFPITDKDLELLGTVSPVIAGKKFSLPTPAMCPECRQQRRLAFRNERKLYKRNCDATGKSIISIYSPDKSYKVFDYDFWWSDAYDPLTYGMEYDSTKSFMRQYSELVANTPKLAIHNSKSENSAYTNYALNNKDCYLIVGASENENCLYSYRIFGNKNTVDSFWLNSSESCFECIDGVGLYKCKYCKNCKNSHNLSFCENCFDSSNCFGCINLRNKEYCIYNKQYTKDEYGKLVAIEFLDTEAAMKKFNSFRTTQPHENLYIVGSENCTGDNITNSNDCHNSYTIKDSQDIRHCFITNGVKDSYDCNFWDYNEVVYNTTNHTHNNRIMCGNLVWHCNDVHYSSICFNSDNLFGCTGMKQNKYCILNKQYTREEYEILVPKIIEKMIADGEWWEYYPAQISPFGYNESIAAEHAPLSREEALKQGFKWCDYDAPFPKVEKIIPAVKLPTDISKIPDDILSWAIECEVTGKPFRIIKQELDFYRKEQLPLPRRHPDQRHIDRMNARNPRMLFDRACDKCGKNIITTYSPDRPEIVYCESCYEKEVI